MYTAFSQKPAYWRVFFLRYRTRILLGTDTYEVTVLSDYITSYDKRKIDEMLRYYESKGCRIACLRDLLG